jgi:hypothetical protein
LELKILLTTFGKRGGETLGMQKAMWAEITMDKNL